MFYIYNLKCNNGYYIGCTGDLKDRINRHLKDQVIATRNKLPIKLEFYFAIDN